MAASCIGVEQRRWILQSWAILLYKQSDLLGCRHQPTGTHGHCCASDENRSEEPSDCSTAITACAISQLAAASGLDARWCQVASEVEHAAPGCARIARVAGMDGDCLSTRHNPQAHATPYPRRDSKIESRTGAHQLRGRMISPAAR